MAIPWLHPLAVLRRFLLPVVLLLGLAQAEAGLVGYWKFDETSGTTASDSSGNGNTGTLTNMTGTEWSTGRVGGALAFDGTNDYVDLGEPASLKLQTFTLATWFKRAGTSSQTTNTGGGFLVAEPLVTKGLGQSDGGTQDLNYFLGVRRSDVKLGADFEDFDTGANHVIGGTTALSNDVWYHAAATYDGTSWALYLDGNLENTRTIGKTPRYDSIMDNAIGSALNTSGSPSGYFQGLIDDVRIYDSALSASEVSALASMGGAGAPEPAETFAFLGLLTAFGLGFREWRSRRKAKAA